MGDTAHLPYGAKSPSAIRKLSVDAALFLHKQGIKALVIACNTASAHSLEILTEKLPIPVIGVVKPAVLCSLEVTEGRIGVIGTESTVASKIYEELIRKGCPNAEVTSLACPLFVPLAEEMLWDHPVTHRIASDYLDNLSGIDTLILGCTHYPLLRGAIEKVLSPGVRIIDSAEATARALKRELEERALLNREGEGTIHSFVTDDPARFARLGSAFLGKELAPPEAATYH